MWIYCQVGEAKVLLELQMMTHWHCLGKAGVVWSPLKG
jgi:hypothetical protein